jgi:diacylglycerol kinase family enzyme
MSAKPNESLSRMQTAERFTLRANKKPFLCQVDGDPLAGGPFTELTVEVLAGHYSLLAPR